MEVRSLDGDRVQSLGQSKLAARWKLELARGDRVQSLDQRSWNQRSWNSESR